MKQKKKPFREDWSFGTANTRTQRPWYAYAWLIDWQSPYKSSIINNSPSVAMRVLSARYARDPPARLTRRKSGLTPGDARKARY